MLVSQAYQLIDKKNVYTEATKDKTFQYSFLSDFAIEQRRRRKKVITRDIITVVRSSVVNLTVLSYFLFKIRLTSRVLIIHIRIS